MLLLLPFPNFIVSKYGLNNEMVVYLLLAISLSFYAWQHHYFVHGDLINSSLKWNTKRGYNSKYTLVYLNFNNRLSRVNLLQVVLENIIYTLTLFKNLKIITFSGYLTTKLQRALQILKCNLYGITKKEITFQPQIIF